jgi:hypothetical protein
VNCTLCGEALESPLSVFGSDESPKCLICWLEPNGAKDAVEPHPFIWAKPHDEIDVPYSVATCIFCGGGMTVSVWNLGLGNPITESDIWITHNCEATCRGNDNMEYATQDCIKQWAISHIRLYADIPPVDKRIPGIKCPALDKMLEAAK